MKITITNLRRILSKNDPDVPGGARLTRVIRASGEDFSGSLSLSCEDWHRYMREFGDTDGFIRADYMWGPAWPERDGLRSDELVAFELL